MSRDIMVKLQSSDGKMLEVGVSIVLELETVRSMIEEKGTGETIHLPNVTSEILEKVIEFARYHVEGRKYSDDKPAVPEDEIKKWDAEFVRVDDTMLVDIILAANYLDYGALLDLLCESETVADVIERKTQEEIGKTVNIKYGCSSEEEEVRKGN